MTTFESLKTVVEFAVFLGMIVFAVGKWVQGRQSKEEVAVEGVAAVRKDLEDLKEAVEDGHKRLRAEVEKKASDQSCADRRQAIQTGIDAVSRTLSNCQGQQEHLMRNLIATEVPKMLTPYMTRETTEAYLKGIQQRLDRIEGLLRSNGGSVKDVVGR